MLVSNSILIVDKPCGHVSHEITTFIKKLFGVKRAGHAGTLDPDVSGVLPVALGKATKLLRFISGKRKVYVGIIKFKNKELSDDKIKLLFKKFTGKIIQTPPKMSAVKKIPRTRTVYSLEFLERKNNLVLFKADVEAGTYIRTLCEDIGKLCGGAKMEELRRISVGSISERTSHTIQDIIDAVEFARQGNYSFLQKILIRPEKFIDFPKTIVKSSAIASIKSGAQIMAPSVVSMENLNKGEFTAIYSDDGRFLGVGKSEVDSSKLTEMERGIIVRLERIHIT